MILASPERIREYTAEGYWGTETLWDRFCQYARAHPDRVALVDPPNKEELVGLSPERLTYRELEQAVGAVAQALVDRGLRKDDVVMVQLPNVWELAMLYLAVARAGGVIAPLPVQWRAKEFSYIAGLTEAAMFITTRRFRGFSGLDMARQLQGQLPALREILTLEDVREMARGAYDEERLGAIPMDANDIFTICWTSGTEAEPKGCPLSHNNWLFQARMLSKATGFGPHQTQLCVAPLVNMTAVGVNFIPWLTFGGTFVLHHPFDAEIFIGQMVQEQVNFTILVPAVINMIAKHPNVDQFDLRAVRTITTGSAPPSLWAMQEFKRRWGIEIVNIWGQNEGTGLVAGPVDVPDLARRADRFPDWGKSGVDWVVQGVRTKLVDPVTKEVLTEVGAVGLATAK